MPMYDYRCEDCGDKFEYLVGVTADKSEIKCKKCGSVNVTRLFSSFNVGGKSGSGSICPTGTCGIS